MRSAIKYVLGRALEKRPDLGHARVGDADEQPGTELLDGLADGCLDLLRLADV